MNESRMSNRFMRCIFSALASAAAAVSLYASAQTFPSKPLRIIIPALQPMP